MTLRDLAFKKQFSPADPAVFGSVDTYATTQSFRCQWRAISAEQQIRAGRDSAERGIRLWYRPYGIELVTGDRVAVNGVDYDVVYAQPVKSRTAIVYVDCKETL